MSALASTDTAQVSTSGPKKKSGKKKKANKAKANGDPAKIAENEKIEGAGFDDGEPEADEVDSQVTKTPIEEKASKAEDNTNANGDLDTQQPNGASLENEITSSTQPESPSTQPTDESDNNIQREVLLDDDTGSRLEALSQEREALRAEVESLRKALEGIQEKHTEEVSSLRGELDESEAAKDQAQTQYQNLLGRVNTIKSSLGERLAADRAELAEAKDQIEELESRNETLQASTKTLEDQIAKLNADSSESSRALSESARELTSLRNRHNLSQQNWLGEREDLLLQVKQLKEEAEAAREAMGDWEVLAMEERSIREGLADRVAELEDQVSDHKELYERAATERDSQSQVVDSLQRALQDIQEARKVELREMVESTQSQLTAMNKVLQEAETRATEAEAARVDLTKELERAAPFEKEVKEKNLHIGKLRHEAIILNDHLTKALRFLKKAKPEDNIDRQIVTNYFLHFLVLDRSDPKRFEILNFIAQLLNWNDEQKEKAGLARPGGSTSSLRIPLSPFHRTPSTPSFSTEFFPETPSVGKETLAELWTDFLKRQADEASTSTRTSTPGEITKPESRG